MSLPFERLEAEALDLPPEERARLARRLLESLDEAGEDPEEMERLWIAEAERRYERHVESGEVARTADEVLLSVRERLRQQ
jgi:hypothetical protein